MEEFEQPTKYKIETSDIREMKLYLNGLRMVCTLYDILSWQRAIYNGKNYGEYHVLFNGKLYTANDWERNYNEITKDAERDEQGFLKDVKHVYLESDIEGKLEELLRDIKDFVYDFMG